ncbi:MAG TPA: hypothetical protein VGE12_20770, partial [Noviherbaspirillum sp.]
MAAGLLFCTRVYADLDAAEYAATAGPATKKEQVFVGRQIEAELKSEEERARREAQVAAARAEAERARLDSRPAAERLTELHCTRCHVAETYLRHRHTWLGWSLVTLRMKYLNGAPNIGETERSAIARHLALRQGMMPDEAVREYAMAVFAACVP